MKNHVPVYDSVNQNRLLGYFPKGFLRSVNKSVASLSGTRLDLAVAHPCYATVSHRDVPMSSRSIDITRVSFAVAVRIDPDDFWNAERILHTSAPLGDLARIREFEPVTCRDGRCHCPRGCR